MAIQVQVRLRNNGESLQIAYPPGYSGSKSGDPDDNELFVSNVPRMVTVDEEQIIMDYIKGLPYGQSLERVGLVYHGEGDPLTSLTHEALDKIESALGFGNTKKAPGGGIRNPLERAIAIRDRGFFGDANAIAALIN